MSTAWRLRGLAALGLLPALSLAAAPEYAAARFLVPDLHHGARFANVFSRTVSTRSDGFDEAVRRVAGTASYQVLDASPQRPRLRVDYHYDGLQQGRGEVELRDGGAVSCFNGHCTPATDASGPTYNPRIWGTPPARLRVGMRWTVDLDAPWELGPAGRQTVTVIALDPATLTVTLKREGRGRGAFAGDRLQATLVRDGVSYPVDLEPGAAHWYGLTTFRAGLVVSDELMSERTLRIRSPKLGTLQGHQRQYILLDTMPVE